MNTEQKFMFAKDLSISLVSKKEFQNPLDAIRESIKYFDLINVELNGKPPLSY